MFKMLLSYRYLDNKRLDQSKTDDTRSTANPDNLSGSPSIQGKSSNTYFTMKTVSSSCSYNGYFNKLP